MAYPILLRRFVVDSSDCEIDAKSLMDILDHSDMVFEEMREQVEICRSSDYEQRVKIDWMDGLVQGLLRLDNLSYAVAKEYPRAWARDVSDKAWTFFAKLSPKRSHSSSSDDDCLSRKERDDSSNVFKRPRRVSPTKSAASRSSSSDSRGSLSSNLNSSDLSDNKASTSSDVEGLKGSNNNREEDLAIYLVQAFQGSGIQKSKVLVQIHKSSKFQSLLFIGRKCSLQDSEQSERGGGQGEEDHREDE